MMRFVKRLIRYLLILFLVLSAGIVAFVYFNKNEIIASGVAEINQYLDAEVQVDQLDVSVIENWPQIVVSLSNVHIKSPSPFQHDLLEADEIHIGFNFLSILDGSYDIKSINIDKAVINLEKSISGKLNYDIFKDSTSSGGQGKIDLRKITLSNSKLNYFNIGSKQEVALQIINLTTRLSINKANITGDISSELALNRFSNSKSTFSFPNFDLNGDFETSGDSLLVNDVSIASSSLEVNASGMVYDTKSGKFRLELSSSSAIFPSIMQELKPIEELAGKYRPKGSLTFDGWISGNISEIDRIIASGNIASENLSAIDPERKLKFQEVSASGKYETTHGFKSAYSTISDIEMNGLVDAFDFEGIINYLRFDTEEYDLQINGNADQNLLKKIYDNEQYNVTSGQFQYDVSLNKAGKLTWSGEFQLENLRAESNTGYLLIENVNGGLLINASELAFQEMSGMINGSPVSFNGIILNPENIGKNDPYYIEGQISSANLDVDQLLFSTESISNQTPSGQSPVRDYTIPTNLNLNLDYRFDKVHYQRFFATNMSGNLLIKNGVLAGQNTEFKSISGKVLGNFIVDTRGNFIEATVDTQISNLSIDSIFYVFNNFSQDWIEDKHISGNISSQINSTLFLTKSLNPIYKTLESNISATVTNGELIEFEPMKRLSRYVEEEELAHLKFDKLTNNITIKDGQVNIPEMKINSNVSDIELSGWHAFDQNIEYHLKVPLKRNYKEDKDTRFGEVASDEDTRTNIFLKITGTTSDYKIAYDRKQALGNIKKELKAEKDELIEAIQNKGLNKSTVELDTTEYFEFSLDSIN